MFSIISQFNLFLLLKSKLALQIFMDAFHGCYKDNCHNFATLYLAVRFVNLLLFSVFHYNLSCHVILFSFVIILALVARFQPYKNKKSNIFDVIALLALNITKASDVG